MKKNLLLLCFIALALFPSCKKVIDPIVEKKIGELLVNKNWNIDEITFVENNNLYHYLRGGQNNTANFQHNILLFKEDKTGSYIDGDFTYQITWELNADDQSKLDFTIYNYLDGAPKDGANALVHLENINLTESHFRYAEIYTHGDQKSVISSVKRVAL